MNGPLFVKSVARLGLSYQFRFWPARLGGGLSINQLSKILGCREIDSDVKNSCLVENYLIGEIRGNKESRRPVGKYFSQQ